MTITFLLPRTGEKPIGGFKIIYEYGNALSERGVKVQYIYGIATRKDLVMPVSLLYRLVRFFRFLRYKFFQEYSPSAWIKMHTSSEHILSFTLSEKNIKSSDVVIASSWVTALWLHNYKRLPASKKFYFIQAFENWHGGDKKVIETWKMPLNKIVISPWLLDIAHKLGEKAVLIENGFNLKDFFVKKPIASRNPYSIMMLWHDNPIKGCELGLTACKKLKEKYPDIRLIMFGVPERPSDIPEWIEYHHQPSKSLLRDLYNDASIFIGTSYSEGWGLTVGEAMLCGCAVACTDNGGYLAMAKHRETALVSHVGDMEALKNNIERLITDDKLRTTIAENASQFVKTYDFTIQAEKFASTILSDGI